MNVMGVRRGAPLIGAVLLVAPGVMLARWAVAQQGVGHRFDQLDRDGDGTITPPELPATAFFRRLDLDGDGAITRSEAVEAVRRDALREPRGRAGGGPTSESLAADSAGPPVREGPKPVRPGDHGVGRRLGDVAFADVSDNARSLAKVADGRITVFAMTSTSCPLSRKYLPTLEQLATTSGEGIVWVLVNPVATDTSADMRAAAARFGERAICVHDAEGTLAAAVGAVTTTDVVVVGTDRTVLYHGAIDDQYGFGYSLDAPRRRYLADALAAIRAGEEPAVSATEAPGCVLDEPAAAAAVSR